MKKILQHLFQTVLLLALAWVVLLLPNASWVSTLNLVIWGLVALVVILMGIYLYRGHKKGLFTLLAGMILCLSQSALAYQTVNCINETGVTINNDAAACSGEGCDYHKCMVEAYKNGGESYYCSLEKNFDVDKAVKENIPYPEEDVKNAVKYLDAYDRAAAAGCVDKSGMFLEGLTLGIISDDAEDGRDCAEDYLKKVAEYKKKKYELNTQTVRQVLMADREHCWPCGLVHIMMVAIEKLALSMEDELSKAALMLLGVMFLFWLLYKVLVLIGQFGTANNAEFFTDLLTRFILAVIAVALLSGPMGVIYRFTFSSLLDVTLGISTQIVAEANSTNTISPENVLSEINGIQGNANQLVGSEVLECACCTNPDSDCNDGGISECRVGGKTEFNALENMGLLLDSEKYNEDGSLVSEEDKRKGIIGLFSREEKQALMCLICKTYKETAPFVAAGQVLVYHAWENKTILSKLIGLFDFLPGVQMVSYIPCPVGMWFIGMALIVCFSWIAYVVAFKLLDVFLRIGFIIILTPFFVTAFVFPISRKYTKRGWDFLAHALLSILAVSMGIAIFMVIFHETLPASRVGALRSVFSIAEVGTDKQEYPNMLMEALGGGDTLGAFFTFLFILLICFCGINVLQASQVIVEGLSGLTCGIPSIAGAAVVGAIRAALAPFRMVKNILLDKANSGILKSWKRAKEDDEKKQEQKENPDQLGVISKIGNFTGKGVEKGGEVAGKVAGKETEGSIKLTGVGVEYGGKGISALGKGVNKIPYVGWIIGVPLMVVGKSMESTGQRIQETAKDAGEAVEKAVKAGSRAVAKGIKKGSEGAQRVWNRTKRNVVNRITQVPAKIKKKFKKFGRRRRAKEKYRHQKETGHGPANWKPSERSDDSKPDPKDKDKDTGKDKDKNKGREGSAPRKDGLGRKILRGALNGVDKADEKVDEGLNAAENSFGDGGNRVLPDTNSDN